MIKSFMSFLKESPVCFFAVSSLKKMFLDAGFEALNMEKHWELAPGGKYFTVVDDSAVFAFTLPEDLRRIKAPVFRMIGAHTDQPCLRIKPCGQIIQSHFHYILSNLFRIFRIVRKSLGVRDHNEDILEFP